jgi:hypothetical protein
MTLLVLTFSDPWAMQMPSPGADWPAMVMSGWVISSPLYR